MHPLLILTRAWSLLRIDRSVPLRAERAGSGVRSLTASLDLRLGLVLAGHDLGPSAPDGEREWWRRVRRRDVPALLVALGEPLWADPLVALRRQDSQRPGGVADRLERALADGVVPSSLQVR